jgi:signal transduction histidine kinase
MSTATETDVAARTGVLRGITVVFAITTLVFLPLTTGYMVDQAEYVPPVWQWTAIGIVFLLPPIFAAVAFRVSAVVLRRLLGAYAVLFAAVAVSWLAVAGSEPLPVTSTPWPLSVMGLGTAAAAIVWRPIAAWAYLVAAGLAIGPLRYFATGAVDWAPALQDVLYGLTIMSVFTALILLTRGNAKGLDLAVTEAQEVAARTASAIARDREQTRLDALVHDEVISALYYASLGDVALDDSVRRQAQHALAELERLRSPDDASEHVEALAFAERIRAISTGLSTHTRCAVSLERAQPVPAEVAAGFGEATAEAIRNSLQHAGAATERSITAVIRDDSIVIEIVDDGVGFDPESLPPHRLGITVSIRGKLAAIPGASATITSTLGDGTTVRLEWRQA